MNENQRESFRIEPDSELDAELFHEGRVAPCTLQNLSAGGAKVTSTLAMPAGGQCTLGVRIGGRLRGSTPVPYVSFLMEVLDATATKSGAMSYRLRSTTAPGSNEYEAAARLVFDAQRRVRARETGTDEASPMATDPKRRAKLRLLRRPRFTKRSLRPGNEDD